MHTSHPLQKEEEKEGTREGHLVRPKSRLLAAVHKEGGKVRDTTLGLGWEESSQLMLGCRAECRYAGESGPQLPNCRRYA